MKRRFSVFAWFLALCAPLPHFGAVVVGQLETFDDPHDWVIAAGPMLSSPQPVPTALGGPAGAADPFLSLVSSGTSGPGSRLTAQNFGEWTGNYTVAGVNQIRMDVRNSGSTDLFLRLLLVQFGMAGPVGAALTSNAIFVPAGSNWQTIAFSLAPQALTATFGTVESVLSNVGELRIFQNQAPAFAPGNNPPIAANLGVDNIAAANIPEPGTGTMVTGVFALALIARRVRRTSIVVRVEH